MLVIFAIVSLRLNFAFGQATIANNVISAIDFLGSSNNIDVLFKANNSPLGRIFSFNNSHSPYPSRSVSRVGKSISA